ncbi:protein Smaug isoform X1 [Lutzomyia longipalpis]|uniref:protein Smaug isoform X1 n=1 Tax=Lutzomyia longipalpis TaxID=7200 RepID=UPI0024834D61|nr:protein Smaug isoform X1 [Lutzomyia longipalpis]XP_055689076.1 protein Smaug isoform X1 [Lutzomyia longipalpis]XP_055689077.1 protein Smaug isoform X1 [Lutzomyia longipalpis]XP_055689078.1 protein Smaug isoform X1 [Lutzomyia longipalpis]
MKYPGQHASTVFCEQVGTVTTLFEQWNDCERTVVLYALLKRVPFANLKFLQLSIEYNIAQNYNSQSRLQILESNSNNGVFLAKLLGAYKGSKSEPPDAVIYETDGMYKRERKEDILSELLTYLPLLKPGNDEAKAVYMAIVPIAVEDSVRQLVPAELVQQILSYLLIHPAVTSDDRRYLIDNTMLTTPFIMRSLGHWLHNLEEYISSPYSSKSQSSCLLDANGSTNSSTSTLWQSPAAGKAECTKWGGVFCDDGAAPMKDFRKTVGKNVEFKATGGSPLYENPSDDQDVSFSKNGTEILDFDDENKSNTKIAFESLTLRDLLAVPSFLDGAAAVLKTRRSNSLTTSGQVTTVTSASAENLAQIVQKPRSFSLTTVESTHGVQALTAGGSETRLDDFRPSLMKTPAHQVGMSGIGQWLKSLRLHKYVWLFTNITYEQMMDITEEHLQNLGVTKGARHKLVLCIQKLKERHSRLVDMEKGLLTDQAFLAPALEELANVVLTPMKPVNHYAKEDVAAQFFKVIELIASLLASKSASGHADEESMNAFIWVLERALHNEAFVAQTNQLKEFKYKMSKIKMQFGASATAKGHYSKSAMNTMGKVRWNPGTKPHKPTDKCGTRKNSTGTLPGYPMPLQQTPYVSDPDSKYHVHHGAPQHHHHQTPSHYSKSSSYPNFSSTSSSSSSSSGKPQPPAAHGFPAQSSGGNYHRHSLNSLMGAKSYFNKENVQRQPAGCAGAPTFSSVLGQQNATEVRQTVVAPKEVDGKSTKSTIGDINSRLEFLCLQMTEQAIN